MLWNDWASALELSCMWQMASVREMAVKEILRLQNSVRADGQKDLLRLSTKLGIREIRDAAINALSDSLRPVEQIQLGIEFQVDSLLLKGYIQVVQAQGGILVEDEKSLGQKTTGKLFRIRDEYLDMKFRGYRAVVAAHSAEDKIKQVFSEELKDAVWGGG
jgi:hypothetical protein